MDQDNYLKIKLKIEELLNSKDDIIVVAIDGKAASGKSSIADAFQREYKAGVVHMDDFFLPMELRTGERLMQPGGNVHYERFMSEVIPYLRKNEDFDYRVFNCGIMDYKGTRRVKNSRLLIVEGAYSLSPRFGDIYDLTVFYDIDYETQLKRIEKRNGRDMLDIFISRWIPMENEYFEKTHIANRSDLTIKAKQTD